MAEPLRVEAPTADLAHELMRRLQRYPTELSEGDPTEVRVTLVGNLDRAVVDVLTSLDQWLIANEVDRVRVHLDDHTYTLTRPQAP